MKVCWQPARMCYNKAMCKDVCAFIDQLVLVLYLQLLKCTLLILATIINPHIHFRTGNLR